jgi:hypothetical protein
MDVISRLMPGLKTQAGIPASYLTNEKRQDSTIVIELGRDYLTKRIKDPFDTLKYLVAPKAPTQQTQATQP